MGRRRSKEIIKLVNDANEFFRKHEVKDHLKSDLFWFVSNKLQEKKCYEGFNFYVKNTNANGEEVLTLAGTANPNKFDCIQLY